MQVNIMRSPESEAGGGQEGAQQAPKRFFEGNAPEAPVDTLDDNGVDISEDGKNAAEGKETANTWTPDPVWDSIRELAPEIVPDDINESNEAELLKTILTKKEKQEYDFNNVKDPFLKEYLENSQNDDFNFHEFITKKANSMDIKRLPKKDAVIEGYKMIYGKSDDNPNGLTEEQIKKAVEDFDDIRLHKEYQEITDKVTTHQNEMTELQKVKYIQDTNKYIDNFLETRGKIPNIAGVEVSKADLEKHNKYFSELTKFDEKGQRPLLELFSDDNLLYELVYLAGENNLKSLINKAKSSVKKTLEEKLSLRKGSKGTSARPSSKGPNWGSFVNKGGDTII
jgi:hypothetical protein